MGMDFVGEVWASLGVENDAGGISRDERFAIVHSRRGEVVY